MAKYYSTLKKAVIDEITSILTHGRSDHELEGYTDEQLEKFIMDQGDLIDKCVKDIINEFEENPEDCELVMKAIEFYETSPDEYSVVEDCTNAGLVNVIVRETVYDIFPAELFYHND